MEQSHFALVAGVYHENLGNQTNDDRGATTEKIEKEERPGKRKVRGIFLLRTSLLRKMDRIEQVAHAQRKNATESKEKRRTSEKVVVKILRGPTCCPVNFR